MSLQLKEAYNKISRASRDNKTIKKELQSVRVDVVSVCRPLSQAMHRVTKTQYGKLPTVEVHIVTLDK
jgi:5-bromo-4-chloroindolyl phosphate hydrolysis protein